jgi:hypothetical protein
MYVLSRSASCASSSCDKPAAFRAARTFCATISIIRESLAALFIPRADRPDDYWTTDFESHFPAWLNVDYGLHLKASTNAWGLDHAGSQENAIAEKVDLMSVGSRIEHLPLWAFILLCTFASVLGFFFFGTLAAAISESLIVISALAGLIIPIVALISVRDRRFKPRTVAQSSPVLDNNPRTNGVGTLPACVPITTHESQLPLLPVSMLPKDPVSIGPSTNVRSSKNDTAGQRHIFSLPNRWWIPGAVVLLLITVAWMSIRQNEVEACNSESVKETLMNGTFQKVKDEGIKFWTTGSPGQNTPRITSALQNWSAEIVNVRQLSYDSANNVRFCEADFEYRNMPPFEVVLPLLGQDTSCARTARYKVQPLLDRPGRFYVSWVCLQ